MEKKIGVIGTIEEVLPCGAIRIKLRPDITLERLETLTDIMITDGRCRFIFLPIKNPKRKVEDGIWELKVNPEEVRKHSKGLMRKGKSVA